MTHKTKTFFFSQTAQMLFFLFALLLISCSAPGKRLEREGLTLAFHSQSSLISEVRELQLEHPIKISTEQTMNHLLLLHYEELTLRGGKKYIFSSDDVLKITPLITKALNRMRANKILYYEVDTPIGITAGTIFQAKGKIHWRFKTIKGMSFENSSFPGYRGTTWRLLPKHGQAYSKSSSILGNEQHQNWIISNLDLSVKSKRGLKLRSSKKLLRNRPPILTHKEPKSSSVNQDKFKKRLKFLKELHDKQLINDDEYGLKRRELLDKFL